MLRSDAVPGHESTAAAWFHAARRRKALLLQSFWTSWGGQGPQPIRCLDFRLEKLDERREWEDVLFATDTVFSYFFFFAF